MSFASLCGLIGDTLAIPGAKVLETVWHADQMMQASTMLLFQWVCN